MVLDYIALGIMVFLILVLVWVALKLGALPGKIAADRGHPQADAIRVSGWVGLITLGVFWPLALIWAYTSTDSMVVAKAGDETGNAMEESQGSETCESTEEEAEA